MKNNFYTLKETVKPMTDNDCADAVDIREFAPIDFDLEIYYRFKGKNDKEQFHNFESKWIFPN